MLNDIALRIHISELWDITCLTQCYLPPDTSERAPPSSSQKGGYSIYLPRRDGRLSWPRWLVTYRDGLPVHTVTHPSTNRARRRVITAIETNALQLSHATTQNRIFFISASLNWVTRDASNIYGPLRIISRLSLEIRLSYLLCSSWGWSDLQGIKVSLPLLY